MLTRNGVEKSTTLLLNQIENVLEDNEEDEQERTEELKENFISYAKFVAYILDTKPYVINDINELKKITTLNEALTEEENIIRAVGHGIWRCPIDASGHVAGMNGHVAKPIEIPKLFEALSGILK